MSENSSNSDSNSSDSEDDAQVFDRNNSTISDISNSEKIAMIRRAIDNIKNSEGDELTIIRKQIAHRLLDMIENKTVSFDGIEKYYLENPDVIDADILKISKIQDKYLIVDIPGFDIKINLYNVIRLAFLTKKPNVIKRLLDANIEVYKIEPKIMTICVKENMDDLLTELIERRTPIHDQDYKCLYELVSRDKLDFIKKILEVYIFPDITEIVGKITVKAIICDKLEIIKYFYPPNVYQSIPDITFEYFINAINYGGHLRIIQYFIEMGVDIRQQNYRAVRVAAEKDRKEIIQYFHKINSDIENHLTPEQREKYGFFKILLMDQYLGTDRSCNIYYDDIGIDDKYYQCSDGKHHFRESAWNELLKHQKKWDCPICQTQVKRILYVNRKKSN